MYTLYKATRSLFLVFCALYVTWCANRLVEASSYIAGGGIAEHAFVVSVVFTAIYAWGFTLYKLWQWRTGSTMTFADLVTEKLDAALDFICFHSMIVTNPLGFAERINALGASIPSKLMSAWVAHLAYHTEHGDRGSLMLDTFGYWLMGTVVLSIGLYFGYEHPFPFVGALLSLVIAVMMVAFTIISWEAWKHYFKHGTAGWKNNGTKRLA
jgi:hypothetical protein